MVSADELAILKEFEAEDAKVADAVKPAPAAPEPQKVRPPQQVEPPAADTTAMADELPPTRVEPERDQAGPEAS